MNKKKWLLGLASTLTLSLALAGCGGGTNQGNNQGNQGGAKPAENKPAAGQQMTIATGGTAGTYYPLGGGIAQILKNKANINANAQTTGASVENMRLLKDGSVDIAFTQGDIAEYAAKGTMMFEKGGAIKNFKALAALYPETIQLVVPANSPIKTIADLKGKKVSVGAPGSGTEANAQQILEVYGLKFEDLKVQRLSFAESTSGLKDGTLDAAFVTAGTPTSAVSELGATKGVRILEVDADHAKKLIDKYPYYAVQKIPGKTYTGQDTDVNTVAVQSMLVVRADLDEKTVYDVTKAIFENLDQLGNVHAKGKEVKLEKALSGVSIEVHPGAAKYYSEKGVKK
ncbi:TAXI family TRAP transporter solute-binding subunit [Effusibacillus lacus]|uniref:C4-dicarboxylate ABC transporter substrate-binding protein n=1 Tax=Effusibacillus lacus TaxID=1348429 RepID=A0A292YQP8_9BACL|nr:TAXI family TRAP transporter solute-binding subunit [Effusibacillus lacus]TCS76900.1 hypothetical protein EDD64_101124 [Effusibacillus lacus]GAX91231.1 C4-dicarboxylate ABC transporter substrate-binding protein [Effusibacillus lacus]